MSTLQSISETLARSTVRIEVQADGVRRSGTGFLFLLDTADGPVPGLVANNHLVLGSATGRVHLPAPLGRRAGPPVVVADFGGHWIPHPDPKIDLAIMPLATLEYAASRAGGSLRPTIVDQRLLPTEGELEALSQVEEVLVMAHPAALRDEAYGQPIVRRAVTASHPALPWNGSPEFLVDLPCPPGTLGAPGCSCNLGGYETKTGGARFGGIRVRLLGVLYGNPRPAAAESAAPGALANLAIAIAGRTLLGFAPVLAERPAAGTGGN